MMHTGTNTSRISNGDIEKVHAIINPGKGINSRLQKGGALLSDMRQMVALWSEELSEKDPVAVLARHIPKTTMVRLKDTFTRAFRPRFI